MPEHSHESDSGKERVTYPRGAGAQMRALLTADRNAAKEHNAPLHTVLRGAPTHTGAYLLQELDKLGWELRRKADRLNLDGITLSCGVCREKGVIPGFWFGTLKTCPACHGKGYR